MGVLQTLIESIDKSCQNEENETRRRRLQEFMGEDWELYENNFEALNLLAEDFLSFTEKTICINCGHETLMPSSQILAIKGKVPSCHWCFAKKV